MSAKKGNSKKGFIADHFLKRSMQRNITDPLAMRLNTLAECIIYVHMIIAIIGAICFAVNSRNGDAFAFSLPLIALAIVFGIIATSRALRVQKVSSSGSVNQTESAYRQGITYICVMSAIYLIAVGILMYCLL